MESYIVQLHFSAAFDRVSHRGLLFKLKSIGVGGIVLSICREFLSNRRERVVVEGATSEWIPIVSGMPKEVCWVLFGSSFMPVKCLSWWRTGYMSMLMTPHYWQLFASQQTDLLLLPPLTGTLLGFRSFAIAGEWYWILTKLRLLWLVDPEPSTLLLVTWFCPGVPFALVQTLTFLAWSLTAGSPSKTMAWYCLQCLSKNWYFEVGEACFCEHLCVASLLLSQEKFHRDAHNRSHLALPETIPAAKIFATLSHWSSWPHPDIPYHRATQATN